MKIPSKDYRILQANMAASLYSRYRSPDNPENTMKNCIEDAKQLLTLSGLEEEEK